MLNDSGATVAGAHVVVTMGIQHVSQSTTSGLDGSWTLRFADGAGDYLVYVSAEGYKALRKRLTRGEPGQPGLIGPDSVFALVTVLPRLVTAQLPTIRVEARRERPERRDERRPSLGLEPSAEEDMSGFVGALRPEEGGNLDSRALTTNAVIADGAGLSAFGLGAAQSNATLGGMAFTGANLPRDIATTTKVATSPYDPSKGWFGGVQVAVEIAPGGLYATRRAHVAGSIPQWQLTSAAGNDLGRRTQSFQASAGGDGSLLGDRFVYNAGVQLSRRTQHVPSLETASLDALRASGIDPAASAQLVGLLAQRGNQAQDRWLRPPSTDEASFALRVDRPAVNLQTYRPQKTTYGATLFGTTRMLTSLGIAPSATPSTGGSSREFVGGAQLAYSTMLPNDWLVDVRSALSSATRAATPYLRAPGGRVLLPSDRESATSTVPDLARGTEELTFGGNGLLDAHSRSFLWETQAEVRLVKSGKRRHAIAVTGDLRLDEGRSTRVIDRYGTYSFHSLDEFQVSRPASFSRSFAESSPQSAVWNAYLAVGDNWRVSRTLQFLFGARLEGNHYTSLPGYNPAAATTFGIATDHVPNTWGLSPRMGFSWIRRSGRLVTRENALGSFPFHSFGVLRGGIGVYRDLLGPGLVARAIGVSGLPGENRSLLCAGAAVPQVFWSELTAPTTCADGASGQPAIVDATARVVALAPSVTAPRSLRSNLAWSSTRWNVSYTLDGTISWNVDQPSYGDANLAAPSSFLLSGEGRPIYVSASRIVPRSGIVDPSGARVADAFGQVLVFGSAGRSLSRELSVRVTPLAAGAQRWRVSGAYAIAHTTQRQSGYEGGAFEDPRLATWQRGDADVRHRFLVQAGYGAKRWSLAAFGRVLSGRPFTPLVGSDINGDGAVNDRAFIYEPSAWRALGEHALATDLTEVLQHAPRHARECLVRQLGRVADRNSCDGPWTAALDARLEVIPRAVESLHSVSVALVLENVLGGVDRVLHGNALRGWGTPSRADQVLYRVASFDPATLRYHYIVNPNFGSAPRATVVQQTPFRLSLDVRVNLGRPREEQQVERFMGAGRAGDPRKRLTASELRQRYARTVIEPYTRIAALADSLLLSREQLEALQTAGTRLRPRVDSIWAALATTLAAVGDEYNPGKVLKMQEDATDAAWSLLRDDLQAVLPHVLAPAQIRLLPSIERTLVNAKPGEVLTIRMSGPG